MRVAVVGHVEWVDFLVVERSPNAGRDRPGEGHVAGGGGRRRRRGRAAAQARRRCDCSTRRSATMRSGAGRYEELSGPRASGSRRSGEPSLSAVLSAFSTRAGSARSRCSDRSSSRVDPIRCPGTSSSRWTASTSPGATSTPFGRHGRQRFWSPRRESCPCFARPASSSTCSSRARPIAAERYDGGLEPAPRYVVRTEGQRGGTVEPGGRFPPGEVPGPVVDAYGAGDAFAAGLTYGLADGMPIEQRAGARIPLRCVSARRPRALRGTAHALKGLRGCAAA